MPRHRYEVWLNGRRIGKRETEGREYTHAVIGQHVKDWDTPDPFTLPGARDRQAQTEADYQRWRSTRKPASYADFTVESYAGSHHLAVQRMTEFRHLHDVQILPVTEVEQWTRCDPAGFPIVSLEEAARQFLTWFESFCGGQQWDELKGRYPGVAALKELAMLEGAVARAEDKKVKKVA